MGSEPVRRTFIRTPRLARKRVQNVKHIGEINHAYPHQ